MDVITYSLRDGQKRSDQYYHDVAAFADEVLAEAEGRAGTLVEAFQAYLQRAGRETPRTRSEYTFELLTLGVLWRVYAGNAQRLAVAPRQALIGLAHLRERGGCLKPGADRLRGALATLFLPLNSRRSTETVTPTVDHLDRLLNWLEATGDFRQEVKRLRAWRDFLADQSPEEATRNLATAITLIKASSGYRSSRMVTGPSLKILTNISAPKTPVSTCSPAWRR